MLIRTSPKNTSQDYIVYAEWLQFKHDWWVFGCIIELYFQLVQLSGLYKKFELGKAKVRS